MKQAPQELIRRKRDGHNLTTAELRTFFTGFLAGEVADYQMGAMLMAITLRGMDARETSDLTGIMRDSGDHYTWPYPRQQIVDKHSTGGVGDKTSLILLPLVLLEGLKVPMMAGRGLGHTGGTLDKLESVGWNVFPNAAAVQRQMAQLGGVIMGQSARMVPLDQRLYAMRDVTATVESVPLIVSSILSKKLAEGIGSLVLDIKYGSGAFMAQREAARDLAQQLARVGGECGLAVRCILSDMGSPLGTHAGNALEVAECIEVLQNRGPFDTRALSLHLAVEMVRLAYPERSYADTHQKLAAHLADGSAWQLFLQLAEAQGGDTELLLRPERLLRAPVRRDVILDGGSVVTAIDTRQLGLAIIALGGGRRFVTDAINPWVGLTGLRRVGDRRISAEPVATIHAADTASAEAAQALLTEAYTFGEAAEPIPLFEEVT